MEKPKIIQSDIVANNWIPVIMGLAGDMGFDGREDHVIPTLLAMTALIGIGHTVQFAEAYFRRAMPVRNYVKAVLTGSERVRGADSMY